MREMAVEQYTESLTLREMKCVLGENSFGCVLPQGDVSGVDKIEKILKRAGGKPKECELEDYSQGGKGKDKYVVLEKAKDIILEPQNYVELIKGNRLKKAYSLRKHFKPPSEMGRTE